MNRQILYVDMDNVMNQFVEYIVQVYNNWYDTQWTFQDVNEYEFYRSFGHDDKSGQVILKKMFSTPGFWLNIKPQENSTKVLRQLNDRYDTYVATMPYNSYNCIPEKLEWLQEHYPFILKDQVIFIHRKNLLLGDYIIDDHPKHLENFKGTTIVYTYKYNEYYKADERVSNWNEIANLLL